MNIQYFEIMLNLTAAHEFYPFFTHRNNESDKHTHTRSMALFPGLPGWTGARKVKPIWILLKQETVSGGGISWAYASLHLAPDRITTPAPHHSLTTVAKNIYFR